MRPRDIPTGCRTCPKCGYLHRAGRTCPKCDANVRPLARVDPAKRGATARMGDRP
jgi:ssDNA-binding Zn-finger/Zn-ribbon topoisomerase 1